jgi:hypothetical protein
MKSVHLLLVITIAAGLLLGTSVGQQADHPSQPAPSQSGGKSTDQQKDEVRNDEDQAHAKDADHNQGPSRDMRRTTTKRRQIASQPKPVPTYRVRPAKTLTTNRPRTDASGIAAPSEQMGKAATIIPNKTLGHRSVTASQPSVAVNGQQFKNSRDPGAHLTSSGGPLTSPRGTASISGTNIKHKP